ARLGAIEATGQWLAPTPPAIARFDLQVALEAARQTIAAGGGNAIDACFDSATYRASSTAERVFHAGCAPATSGGVPRFATFAFWDGIHPTAAAHAAIGAALGALF
ncbi:MAG TPA: hypothetical protein VM692_12500, partial [Gammaproteobacteria bacterium]|nr:hypothetical protein [Gammaproteobacteria bacterium]